MPALSVFDIFKIGVGPSSSHTVGPMKAAYSFAEQLAQAALPVSRLRVTLYGSLAYTGKGHATDTAVLLGLMGHEPETLDPDDVEPAIRAVYDQSQLTVPGVGDLAVAPADDVVFEALRRLIVLPMFHVPGEEARE